MPSLAQGLLSWQSSSGQLPKQAQLEMENALQQIGKRVFGHYR